MKNDDLLAAYEEMQDKIADGLHGNRLASTEVYDKADELRALILERMKEPSDQG